MPKAKTKTVTPGDNHDNKAGEQSTVPTTTAIAVAAPPEPSEGYLPETAPELEQVTLKPILKPVIKEPEYFVRRKNPKANGKNLKSAFIYLHPDNGTYSFEYIVPRIDQRPFNLRNHVGWKNKLSWFFWRRRVRLYVYREVKYFLDEAQTAWVYLLTPYEPDPLTVDDITPEEGRDATDYSCVQGYFDSMVESQWRDVIESGLIVVCILVLVVLTYFVWSKAMRGG